MNVYADVIIFDLRMRTERVRRLPKKPLINCQRNGKETWARIGHEGGILFYFLSSQKENTRPDARDQNSIRGSRVAEITRCPGKKRKWHHSWFPEWFFLTLLAAKRGWFIAVYFANEIELSAFSQFLALKYLIILHLKKIINIFIGDNWLIKTITIPF